jgi:hypothetical protein
MPAYYPIDMLSEMEQESLKARERLATWMGTQTFKNLRRTGDKSLTLKECINSYRNTFNEQENTD